MLKHIALRLFGAAVSSWAGQRFLTALSRPHRHLHDLDGSLYMGRWRIVDEDSPVGKVMEYLTGYASARLHLIMREDHDRDLHNHPFAYRSFIVRGHYSEVCQDGLYGSPYYHEVTQGQTVTGSARKFHRIAHVPVGGVPDEIPAVSLAGAPLGIGALLKQANLAPSSSEALRLVEGGGVLTLFFMTRNRAAEGSSGWGFNVEGKFVDSVRYLLRKGYRREQVQEVQTR